jgi:mycothiol maleylpyruvate isomerase-like protein
MQIETWTRDRVLETELAGHEALEAAVARAGTGRLDEPGAGGDDWSIKDVLAHIAFGQEWLAAQLERVARGEEPGRDELAAMDPRLAEVESRNRLVHEQNRERSVDDVLAWWRETWIRCRRAQEELPESAYYKPQWWTQGWPLVRGLDPNHRLEHAKEIERWLGPRAT